MTIRTITFDDEQWQLVPQVPEKKQFVAGAVHTTFSLADDPMVARGRAIATYRDMLAAAPEPPAQPRRPYGTDTLSEYGVIPECDGPEPPAQPEAPTRDLLAEARDQVEALDRENHQMRRCVARLMARLTVWLDDDQFNEADGIMYPEFEPPAQQQDEQLPPYSAWMHVLDEAMVVRHLGVADPDDDYITAKRKLHAMFDWEIDVATDPAVGGDRVRKQQPMTPAAIDVLAERRRQVEAEGWTPEHDDAYDSGSLAKAAACYALSSVGVRGDDDAQLRFWPWLDTWWKPSTPRRDLVKAGALILAEIERLDRVGKGESDD